MTQPNPNNQRRIVAVLGFSLLALAVIVRVVLATSPAPPDSAVQIIPSIAISKLPDTQEIGQGGTATFTIEVTNNGLANLQNVEVTDSLAPDCNKTIGSLAIGASDSYICTRPNVPESFLNEAVASGEDTLLQLPVSDSDTAFVKVLNPAIKILKTPETQTILKGGTAAFNIIVLNTSSVALTDVKVIDALASDCVEELGTLAAGENREYDCQKSNVNNAFVNTAIVQATHEGAPVTDSDTAVVEILDLGVNLTANPTTLPEPGGVVHFTVTVTNDSSIDVTLTSLNSTPYGELIGGPNSSVQNNNCEESPIAAGSEYTCSFEATFSKQPGAYQVSLTATAENVISVSANDSTTVTITNRPSSLAVSLTANPTTVTAPGAPVAFTVHVENTSPADAITLTSLADTLLGNLQGKGSCALPQAMPVGDTYQCTFTAMVAGAPGNQTNQVTASGTDDDGSSVSADDGVVVSITAPPTSFLYLPVTLDTNDEPNNNCSQAFPVTINKDSFFLANDTQDWYWFDLPQATNNLVVQLTNFVPVAGQMIVYASGAGECSNLQFLQNNGDFSSTKIVSLGQRAPGRYYIRVINDGPTNTKDFYKLRINAP